MANFVVLPAMSLFLYELPWPQSTAVDGVHPEPSVCAPVTDGAFEEVGLGRAGGARRESQSGGKGLATG